MQENISNIIVYSDGELELKVSVENESVWLNLNQICELFDRDKNEVILIDNYIDETVFTLFSKYLNIKIQNLKISKIKSQ